MRVLFARSIYPSFDKAGFLARTISCVHFSAIGRVAFIARTSRVPDLVFGRLVLRYIVMENYFELLLFRKILFSAVYLREEYSMHTDALSTGLINICTEHSPFLSVLDCKILLS